MNLNYSMYENEQTLLSHSNDFKVLLYQFQLIYFEFEFTSQIILYHQFPLLLNFLIIMNYLHIEDIKTNIEHAYLNCF